VSTSPSTIPGALPAGKTCVDPVVGDILAGWRYDISGLAPAMRGDYELHLAECARCRGKQRLHRGVDIGLMVLASASAVVFLLAFGLIRHFHPVHAPLVVAGLARSGARRVHDRLPPEIRERIPAELRAKL
jgi:hypothetical protein